MSASDTKSRREHGLKPEDPLHCPRCGAGTYRAKFHWPSALRCAGCGEKAVDCRCAAK